jgi:hypothetical protein
MDAKFGESPASCWAAKQNSMPWPTQKKDSVGLEAGLKIAQFALH